MARKKAEVGQLTIQPLKRSRITLRIIGQTPLYYNNMSAKAKRDLLVGAGRKTAAERRELKHDPEKEFRDSTFKIASSETLLGFPAEAIKTAMMTAALETAGVTKKSVERLVTVPGYLSIWGRPYLKMDVVRSADIAKTPDIRTRAFLPQWASQVSIDFITPTLSAHAIASLLTNAGMICGIGDFRQEKGKGAYGTFAVVGDDLGEWKETWERLQGEGRDVQMEALDNPEAADDETAELLEFIAGERIRRAA